MNSPAYLRILKENLKQSAESLGINSTFQFYQDNDRKHKEWNVRMWLLMNCPKVIQTPPQSPNLNVIENLWDELNRKIRQILITSKTELKRRLVEEWAKISPQYTRTLVSSMPRRVKAVLRQNGYSTKY